MNRTVEYSLNHSLTGSTLQQALDLLEQLPSKPDEVRYTESEYRFYHNGQLIGWDNYGAEPDWSDVQRANRA